MMTKNEIAKKIRNDLKNEFGKTMKFTVRSRYCGGTPNITVTIKEAQEQYFKTPDEFELEHLDLKLEQNPLYETLKRQYSQKGLNSIKKEIIDKIGDICNKYNYNNSDPYTDYFDVGYYLDIIDSLKPIKMI